MNFWSFGNKFSFTGPTTTNLTIRTAHTIYAHTNTYDTPCFICYTYILCRKTLGFKNAVFSASTKTVASFAFDLLVLKERTNSTNWGPEHPDNRSCGLQTLSQVLLKQNRQAGIWWDYPYVRSMYVCRTRNGKSGCSFFSSQLVTSYSTLLFFFFFLVASNYVSW